MDERHFSIPTHNTLLAATKRGHRAVQSFLFTPFDVDLDEAGSVCVGVVELRDVDPDELMLGAAGRT